MTTYTAIDGVITAIVAALDTALDIPVYDGATNLNNLPSTTSYVIIGGSEPDTTVTDDEMAEMEQQWHGLGAKTRLEDIMIHCVAVGRATDSSASTARGMALAIIESVAANLPQQPNDVSHNAILDQVKRLERGYAQSGAVVRAYFTISVKARLAP